MSDNIPLDFEAKRKKVSALRCALLSIMGDIDYLEGHYAGMLDAIQEMAELHISSIRTQVLNLIEKLPELKDLKDDPNL